MQKEEEEEEALITLPDGREIIYVDKQLKPCSKLQAGARRAKYNHDYELYVVE